MAARLKGHDKRAYGEIRDVENYAQLTTCRRERLLRHFGDKEEVAPCGGCDICLGEADAAITRSNLPDSYRVPRITPAAASVGTTPDSGEVNEELLARLKSWRSDQARDQQVPAYVVLHNSHLEEISARQPGDIHELGAIKGIGLRRAARYGDDILALIRGDEPAVSAIEKPDNTSNGPAPDYRKHIQEAENLLRSGRGAEAVPELARALETGGEEARQAVDNLLNPTS
jgi:superfamily II DNA helicase RecQ